MTASLDAMLRAATERAADALLSSRLVVATAESCTGGLVARQLTEISGSSLWFDRGFVVYSNQSKVELLGVDPATLASDGAVSSAVARELVRGALDRSYAQLAVSTTGVAGPRGGSPDKPVGLVWFGFGVRGGTIDSVERLFDGDRAAIRAQAATYALDELARRARASVPQIV